MSDNRRGLRKNVSDDGEKYVLFDIDPNIQRLTLAWSIFTFIGRKGNDATKSLYLRINHDSCIDHALSKTDIRERDLLECKIDMISNTGVAVDRTSTKIDKWKIKKK